MSLGVPDDLALELALDLPLIPNGHLTARVVDQGHPLKVDADDCVEMSQSEDEVAKLLRRQWLAEVNEDVSPDELLVVVAEQLGELRVHRG